MLSFLDREFSVARPGFSRWLVPPAALSIHLAIGQVYSFSIFKNPLLALKGADGMAWNLKEVGYIFSIAIAVLGLSAALFGRWLERRDLARRCLSQLLASDPDFWWRLRARRHILWRSSISATESSVESGWGWAISHRSRR